MSLNGIKSHDSLYDIDKDNNISIADRGLLIKLILGKKSTGGGTSGGGGGGGFVIWPPRTPTPTPTPTTTPTPTPVYTSEVWVNSSYNASNYGVHTWEYDAFDKIQDGIDNVSTPGTVQVAAGTYYENIVLKDGVEVLGAGNATTIIDGMKNGSVVTTRNVGNTTRLDGFTVTNGSGTVIDLVCSGGGMININSSPAITNCRFQSNSAILYGGYVGGGGGGMSNSNSSPMINNCTFQNNSALYGGGGGMVNGHSSPVITNCKFVNNSANTNYGGGIYNSHSSPNITNCNFVNNSARQGGGMATEYCWSAITNCNFLNNSALYGNSGAIFTYASSPTITNCILWNDTPGEIYVYSPSWLSVNYCDVKDGYAGTGNINSDPMFVDAAAGDFHLLDGSPCIDTGSNAAPAIPTTDFEGDPRIMDGNLDGIAMVDMGVDEYVPSSTPTVTPTITPTVTPSVEPTPVPLTLIVMGNDDMGFSNKGNIHVSPTPLEGYSDFNAIYGGYQTSLTFPKGTVVTFTATVSGMARFLGWEVNGESTVSNPITVQYKGGEIISAGFWAPDPTPTPTPTATPTPTPTPTPTTTPFCPTPSPEPLSIGPVISPTDQLSQTIHVYCGRCDAVTITCEAGTFSTWNSSGGGIDVTLLPDTTNHLVVHAHYAAWTTGGCYYPEYNLSTWTITIVQRSNNITPTPTPTPAP